MKARLCQTGGEVVITLSMKDLVDLTVKGFAYARIRGVDYVVRMADGKEAL